MEKRDLVDQKSAARFERVRAELAAQPAVFAAQGAVVATWREYRGRRLGPYFQVAYRRGGRQRSIYLGRCEELARRVRELLARLQRPRRQRRTFARLKAQVRSSLRRWKVHLKKQLAAWGIRLKGFEFRGVGRATQLSSPAWGPFFGGVGGGGLPGPGRRSPGAGRRCPSRCRAGPTLPGSG